MSTSILLPNYSVYEELAQLSSTLNTGRAVLQKRIMALLRKIETANHGVWQAWDDTYINWDNSTKHFTSFPKQKSDDVQPSDTTFHRMGKRRASHHSTEHEQEDQVNEWANMTGAVFFSISRFFLFKYFRFHEFFFNSNIFNFTSFFNSNIFNFTNF